jgi:hypothetical protein
MEASVSRQFIEGLLTSFLSAALGLELHVSIDKLERLPEAHRERLQALETEPIIWVAWESNRGVVIATGNYDADQSRRVGAHVLMIQWWIPPDTHHAGWWRANPKRLTEWTAGVGYAFSAPESAGARRPSAAER